MEKELTLTAILGPIDDINHREFHCSPLMTLPEEGDNRRVILNLSYPKGNSLYDHLTKDLFDSTVFALKLPSIDWISNDIISTDDDLALFKADVEKAFRNLPVDPADSLKFGIKWNN